MPDDDESLVTIEKEFFTDSILSQNKDEIAKFTDQPFSSMMPGWLGH